MIDTWKNVDNNLHKDFEIYSSLEDLHAGRNKWSFCNYNDYRWKIGFPRDCGPKGYIPWDWISLKHHRSPKNG